MAKWNLRSKRKPTGGLLSRNLKKKKRNRGNKFLGVSVEERNLKSIRTRGNNVKLRLLSEDSANVANKGKIEKAKILSVKENKANPHFVRRNLLTKGAIIETDKGLAKVTSKPTHNGVVNAVLIEK